MSVTMSWYRTGTIKALARQLQQVHRFGVGRRFVSSVAAMRRMTRWPTPDEQSGAQHHESGPY